MNSKMNLKNNKPVVLGYHKCHCTQQLRLALCLVLLLRHSLTTYSSRYSQSYLISSWVINHSLDFNQTYLK